MGDKPAKLEGPDLAAGVAARELQEGKPLLGHAGGEPVMLVKRGDDVFAVSSTCTHYSGPLAAGLVVGDTIRCPWHHACFDLRTGEPDRAPALSPISCYATERIGPLVRVGKKITGGRRQRASAVAPASIVIVGAGGAGNAAAETLRREGYGGPVTLVGDEDTLPVDRPNLSKDYLAGTAPEEWIPLRGRDFYREQGIDLVLGTRAQSLDTKARTLALADGRSLTWDRLLLATGARPHRIEVPGGDQRHVHTLRSLADSRAIVAAATRAGSKNAVVVGASFIGMEAAAALRARGIEVTVVATGALPFERVLGPGLGDFLRSVHAEHGVAFRPAATIESIGERDVTLVGGAKLAADLVVVGIGVAPAVELASSAGLGVDHGVTVDGYLETGARGVFAAGDVARWPDPRTGRPIRVEHWVVAERMGQTAARNMLGLRKTFDAVPFFWSVQYDVTLNYVGHAETWDRIDVDGSLEARDASLAYRVRRPGGAGDQTLAVVTIGRDRISLEAERAFERGDEAELQRLVPRRDGKTSE